MPLKIIIAEYLDKHPPGSGGSSIHVGYWIRQGCRVGLVLTLWICFRHAKGVSRTPLYVKHAADRGVELFDPVCSQDKDGVFAKLSQRPIPLEAITWGAGCRKGHAVSPQDAGGPESEMLRTAFRRRALVRLFREAEDLWRQTRRRLGFLRFPHRRRARRQKNGLPPPFHTSLAFEFLFERPPAIRTDIEFPALDLFLKTLL